MAEKITNAGIGGLVKIAFEDTVKKDMKDIKEPDVDFDKVWKRIEAQTVKNETQEEDLMRASVPDLTKFAFNTLAENEETKDDVDFGKVFDDVMSKKDDVGIWLSTYTDYALSDFDAEQADALGDLINFWECGPDIFVLAADPDISAYRMESVGDLDCYARQSSEYSYESIKDDIKEITDPSLNESDVGRTTQNSIDRWTRQMLLSGDLARNDLEPANKTEKDVDIEAEQNNKEEDTSEEL